MIPTTNQIVYNQKEWHKEHCSNNQHNPTEYDLTLDKNKNNIIKYEQTNTTR